MDLEKLFTNKMQELNCYANDLGFKFFKDWGEKQFDQKKISSYDNSRIYLYHNMRNIISHGFAGKVLIDEEDIKFLDKYIKIFKEILGIVDEPPKKETPYKNINHKEDNPNNKANKEYIISYIKKLLLDAKNRGEKSIVLRAGNIEKEVGLKQRIASVCSAMYACMGENDEILHTTNSRNSTTVLIKYYL